MRPSKNGAKKSVDTLEKKTYMMGLDVKEPLVVLKRPKRGTFLLPWEKLKFKDLVEKLN